MSEVGSTIFNRVDYRQMYGDDLSTKAGKAQQILTKFAPAFQDKWTLLQDDELLSRLSDHDVIVVVDTIASLRNQRPIKYYLCDDWEVFAANLEFQHI